MSNKKHSESLIKNEDTLRRRAWVEQALAGVRVRAGTDVRPCEERDGSSKPRLYLVDPGRDR